MSAITRRAIWQAYLLHAGVRYIAAAFGVSVQVVEVVIRRRGR